MIGCMMADMLPRQTIETQLRHYRHECSGTAEKRRYGVQTLEWVLGDADHRQDYERGIAALKEIAEDEESSPIILRYALLSALRLLA